MWSESWKIKYHTPFIHKYYQSSLSGYQSTSSYNNIDIKYLTKRWEVLSWDLWPSNTSMPLRRNAKPSKFLPNSNSNPMTTRGEYVEILMILTKMRYPSNLCSRNSQLNLPKNNPKGPSTPWNNWLSLLCLNHLLKIYRLNDKAW